MNYKTDAYRRQNARYMREKRARWRQRMMLLPDHIRLCIDCGDPFMSCGGNNVCAPCIQKVWDSAERSTPLRTRKTVTVKQVYTALYRRYGHAYKASLTPRIPLSEITVFQATGRKR